MTTAKPRPAASVAHLAKKVDKTLEIVEAMQKDIATSASTLAASKAASTDAKVSKIAKAIGTAQ